MTEAALAWDYTDLARHYAARAPYSASALRDLFDLVRLPRGSPCIDIGAGTGRLTAALVAEAFEVCAVEPNPAMRAIGAADVPGACWLDARGESTGLEAACARLVTFGSSFNVLPAQAALDETARLLQPDGWLACLWNHRDLDDPLQALVQSTVDRQVPGYAHGSRREDPGPLIDADARFGDVERIAVGFTHELATADFIDGFRAHATLVRQAGAAMPAVLDALAARLVGRKRIAVPFVTRIYAAQRTHVA